MKNYPHQIKLHKVGALEGHLIIILD
jgi:hypothetical protein